MKQLTLILSILLSTVFSYAQTLTVYFEFNESQLDNKSLTSITDLIKTNKSKEVNLTGLADTVGTIDYNKLLVQRRLVAVEKALLNIDESIRIEKINYGEEKSSSNEAKFRRVDVSLSKRTYTEKEPNYQKPQSFFIDNTKDTIIECDRGTKIKIPKNSLIVEETKSIPQGHIKLQVTEYYELHEMIDANLSTQSDNEILETGGMLYMQAWFNGKECVLKDDSGIEIHFRDIVESDSMQIFIGNQTESRINWELPQEASLEITEKTYFIVENMPTFLGGNIKSFKEYVNSKLKYPVIAQENGIQGQVFVSFIIDELGQITNTKVVRGVHPYLNSEALRVIGLAPRWTPGTQGGKAVPVQMTVPITFTLGGEFPLGDINRIAVMSESYTFMHEDSLDRKYERINEFVSEFYLRANRLGWINCDRFYYYTRKRDIDIIVESEYESYYAVFNKNRSIMLPNLYNLKSKTRSFNNIPLNQEIMIIGIKVSKGETYFTSFEVKPRKDSYTPIFEKIDKKELITTMKKIH
ncbi:TonB family protein [Labilibacter sediminis]|nr:TonB family protein [Labilibacter sediminis]